MITRNDAMAFVSANLKNKNLIKHCLASEAVMRALARRLGGDEEQWGLAGLLHDADVETSSPEEQGRKVGDILAEKITPEMRCAMAAHNTKTGTLPESKFDFALTSGETITGLIVAAALVIPDRKLALLTKESVVKRFHEKRFAAGADRGLILHCEKLGLSLDEFAEIALGAMQGISEELGL
jgi:predicted hydrolase (HD superfamily)